MLKWKFGICQGLQKRQLDFSRRRGYSPKQISASIVTAWLYTLSINILSRIVQPGHVWNKSVCLSIRGVLTVEYDLSLQFVSYESSSVAWCERELCISQRTVVNWNDSLLEVCIVSVQQKTVGTLEELII